METSKRARVLTVDDDAMVRDAYRSFFRNNEEFVLVGEARDGAEAIEAYAQLLPDVVLMDLQMPGTSGIEATRRICERYSDACIVVLTTFGTREHVVAALRAGASGYLLKDVSSDSLYAAIRQAQAGDMPLSSPIRRQLVNTLTEEPRQRENKSASLGLTPREVELLGWLAQGLTNSQIGARMYISEGSVKQYINHIATKMGVKSRTQILVKSIQYNVIDPHKVPMS